MTIETTAAAVARAYRKACKEVDNARNVQARQMTDSAKPGETFTVPKRPTGQYFDLANSGVSAAREEALDIIGKARKHASSKLVEAPSAEAANYCATLQGRDDLTENEISAALAKYPNHSAQQAILAAARRSGIHAYAVSETQADLDALDGLENMVHSYFTPFGIADGGEAQRGVVAYSLENYDPGQSAGQMLRGIFND